MALEVRGVPILSEGEFHRMARGLEPGADAHPVVVAWRFGEPVTPRALYLALDIGTRSVAQTDDARQMIDLALHRLESAFPEVGPE